MTGTTGASPNDLEPLLDLAVGAAHEAGELLLELWTRSLPSRAKTSGSDRVSDADVAAEQLVTARIVADRPDDGILAEEGMRAAAPSGYRWVLDPLDGTANFLHGRREFTVSIAVEDADGPCVAVVHAPAFAATYTALRGRGAWVDGAQIEIGDDTANVDESLVATGFSYDPSHRRHQAERLTTILPPFGALSDRCAVFGRASVAELAPPDDPLCEWIAVRGDPEKASRACRRRARGYEIASAVILGAGLLANFALVMIVIGELL